MDAVILAAGRGERVRDLTPAFHKPLLPIDGVPLVCRAVDLAHAVNIRFPVVVAAPANVEAISGALGDRDVHIIVQRKPLGPGHALLTGLHVKPLFSATSARVLVLLSDNVSTVEDLEDVISEKPSAVGVKLIDRDDVGRFTRFENDEWVERKQLGNLYGPDIPCWVGPFVGMRELMQQKLEQELKTAEGELLIGPHLRSFMHDGKNKLVSVSSYDVGTLASYPNAK